MYVLLMGEPGTRKSTAVLGIKKVIAMTGYEHIAASKTTKEKYMMDLAGIGDEDGEWEAGRTRGRGKDVKVLNLEDNLFGGDNRQAAESFIMAHEFNDFFGNNNLEFISLLGTLWDHEGPYKNRVKNGKSFSIPDLVINMLGGNTPTTFAKTFPPEIIGQGFFSRLILVFSEPTGIKIPFPEEKPEEEVAIVAAALGKTKEIFGEISIEAGAKGMLSHIYITWKPVDDVRFISYCSRRFTQLLKLCSLHAIARLSTCIEIQDVVMASTVLHAAERQMSKALGEFGKSRNSDVSQKIMQVLEANVMPMSLKDLWKHVISDLEKFNDLAELMRNLVNAEKVQIVDSGFLRRRSEKKEVTDGTVNWSLLTEQEREQIRVEG